MAVTLKGSAAELMGLSTDSKPSDPDLNTIFHELDTGKMYYYDGTEWAEGVESSGGSGGGSDCPFVKVNLTFEEGDPTIDKTFEELTAIIAGGKSPFLFSTGGVYFVPFFNDGDTSLIFEQIINYSSGTTAGGSQIEVTSADAVTIKYYDVTVSNVTS